MNERTIVNLTLEFTLQIPNSEAHATSIIAETMMQGAVNGTQRNVTGTGYTYNYTHKKSRRGMTVRNKK